MISDGSRRVLGQGQAKADASRAKQRNVDSSAHERLPHIRRRYLQLRWTRSSHVVGSFATPAVFIKAQRDVDAMTLKASKRPIRGR